MQIHPIRTDQDYRAALKALSDGCLTHEPQPGTPEGDYFDVMVTLVEAYEAKHFPVDLPNPVDAIKFRMEQSGLTASDRPRRLDEPIASTKCSTEPVP